MKKNLLLFALVILLAISANGQDFKIGVRFTPLNSQYMTGELLSYNRTVTNFTKSTNRFDSLTMGIFCEKYFTKKAFLLRMDINYADMCTNVSDSQNYVSSTQNYSNFESEKLSQKCININLGIGTHVNWNKFIFTFGVYVPLTILPRGKGEGGYTYYSATTLSNKSTYTTDYKPTMAFGIGAFGGVSVIILKHLSLGIDVAYHIQYLSRKQSTYTENYYYTGNPYMTYSDQHDKIRNYYTSKIIPSIVIAYCFDVKKKEK